MNHAHRSPYSPARPPTGGEVRTARLAAKLTPEAAGAIVYERASRWLAFELGNARMHPAAWELFKLKAAAPIVDTLANLATHVYLSEDFEPPERGADIALRDVRNVLDVALRQRLGLACLGGRRIALDLGNGHFLDCSVRGASV